MTNDKTQARVGLVSDTHGKLDPRVLDAFEGVDSIIHAGDIGGLSAMWQLEAITCDVTAVLGNTDLEVPGYDLKQQARVRIAGKEFLVIHDVSTLGPAPEDVDVVVQRTHPRAVGGGSRRDAVREPRSGTATDEGPVAYRGDPHDRR